MRADYRWALFWIFILVAAPALGQNGESVVVPVARLVSHWTADMTFEDATLNHNDGSSVGGASFSPDGIAGQAFSLDGASGYILVHNHPTLNFGVHDFSLSVWMKTKFNGPGAGTDFLISKVETGTTFEYSLQYNSNRDRRAHFAVGAQGRGESLSGGPELGDNNWHHIVGVRNGTVLLLFVDCVQVARSSCIGCDAINSTGSRNVTIRGRENSGDDPYFAGLIDEVAVYGSALSDTEVKVIYEGISRKRCPKKTG